MQLIYHSEIRWRRKEVQNERNQNVEHWNPNPTRETRKKKDEDEEDYKRHRLVILCKSVLLRGNYPDARTRQAGSNMAVAHYDAV